MDDRCPLCRKTKASRRCPALGQAVCPRCCGQGRGRTIDCPEECRHYQEARGRALLKLMALAADRELEVDWHDVLHNLRLALVRVQGERVADATAAEASEALDNAAMTVRTRANGLIYEYRSHDPRVQFLADELLRVAEGHRTGAAGFRRVGPDEVLGCLRYIRRQAEAARKRGSDYFGLTGQAVGRSYVTATAPGGGGSAATGLIDPGSPGGMVRDR